MPLTQQVVVVTEVHTEVSLVVVEHWDHKVGLLPGGNFTLAVHVPGASQDGGEVGVLLHYLIVHCRTGGGGIGSGQCWGAGGGGVQQESGWESPQQTSLDGP